MTNESTTNPDWEKTSADLQGEIAADGMSPQEEIADQLARSGVQGYLDRPYQWMPPEGSLVSRLTAILCPKQIEIPRMQSCLLSDDGQMGYLDYLADRVAWMMLQEESFQQAQEIVEYYLLQDGWTQLELPEKQKSTALEWGQALTVYHFEFQEWLQGAFTENRADLQFPLHPVPTTAEAIETLTETTLEEWMISVATIYKEYD